MKFTTSAALAVAATGVSAQDTWSAWPSSASGSSSSSESVSATSSIAQSCPETLTSVETTTTTCYESTSDIYQQTVTVPIPSQPASVSVEPQWVDWNTIDTTGAPVTSMPAGCTAGKTVTSTSTITSTIPGTTTMTKSIMYVGATVTGNADAAWSAWNTAAAASESGSGSGSGSGLGSNNNGNGNGGDSWSNNGQDSNGQGNSNSNGQGSNGNSNGHGQANNGNSNGNGVADNDQSNNGQDNNGNAWGSSSGSGSSNSADSGSNNNQDSWGRGSWGGKGTGGRRVGSGNEVFHWTEQVPTNTQSGSAPEYTKNSDGSYSGKPWGGAWGDHDNDDEGGSDSDNNSGSDSDNNSGKNNGTVPNNSGKNNGTAPNYGGQNGTSADTGSAASNVTKPFEFLQDSDCNSASDRSQWCGNTNIDTDYYQDYWGKSGKGSSSGGPSGGSCNYDLVITNGTWNADGTEMGMLLVNGQYPGPAIECNWGDWVTINVHNEMESNGTTIHWHGLRQFGTNDQDGVPGVTECSVAPGQSRSYQWRASSYGTSWYHSHWNLQYGDGVVGPIIIHGPATANYDVDAGPVMIADTFGMSATAFGSIVAHVGPAAVDNYLLNGHNTKADLSAGQHSLWKVQKGKKYLFRLINSAAQNMYSVSIDQHKMKVIASDFVPIVPYTTEWVNIGIGQRYDVVVEMDQDVDSYFFRAVTQTLCPSGSVNSGLGQANGIIAYEGVQETPYLLPTSTLNGNKTAADFAICYDEPLASLVPHLKMNAGTQSAFQASASTIPGGTVSTVSTSDDGAVFRWFLNNGALYINYTQPTLQSLNQGYKTNDTVFGNQITLNQKDQWVYFVIQNQFFAFHPMHLHGHDFSVLGQGDGLFTADMVSTLNFDNPARRDTAMLRGAASPTASSGGYTVIGFETDNPGAWLMHCHIAWHVDGGLALQWIERPDDIDSYAEGQAFKDECSNYASYEETNPSGVKLSGMSGLKRREDTYFDRMIEKANRQFNSVVRREEHAGHHFLEGHLKRGLGDGAHRRTFGRRR